MDPDRLYQEPNALAPHYSNFRVAERLLLTGHSHQAWPDCGRDGQLEAWDDAARLVDRKWERAAEKANVVRSGFGRLLGISPDQVALGANTHELVIRFLSALPLKHRNRIITTDGEFHTIRRQLDRIAEEDLLDIVKVPSTHADEVAERIVGYVTDRTAAVLVSAVLFRSARIVPHLDEIMHACDAAGVKFLVDAYHAINVVPFNLPAMGLDHAFVTGGGYKYCQLGEGNCFLRIPPGSTMRPVITGWFSEFGKLTESHQTGKIPYAIGPDRFAGATYDPVSHYRGARVFEFFEQQELTPPVLRKISRHQVDQLCENFDRLDLDPSLITRDRSTDPELTAGFLALSTPGAAEIHRPLLAAGVLTDYRDDMLRFGPAPYLSDTQLADAMGLLGEVVRSGR